MAGYIAGSTASWAEGPRGNRGRGGTFGPKLQLGSCLSLGKLHLFNLHSEPPEEKAIEEDKKY